MLDAAINNFGGFQELFRPQMYLPSGTFTVLLYMPKKKFYVVWTGNVPGVYDSWAATQRQVAGFKGARFQGFPTRAAAEQAFKAGPPAKTAASKQTRTKSVSGPKGSYIRNSISVDAACSGNPGPMEYQGVITADSRQIFHQAFPRGTNNIGEFLAIVHGLALLQAQNKPDTAIYSDSKIAMGWVKKKHAKTTLKHDAKTEKLHQYITRAETWLKNNTYTNPILKWPTEKWGEIPADFGRK